MWVFSLLQTQTCGALTHWFAQTLFGFHLLSSALLSIKWPSGGFINSRSMREPAFCHYSLNNLTCIRLKQAGITHQPGMTMFNSYLNSATLIYLPSVSMQRETSVIFQTQSQNSQQKHGGCRKSCICMSWSNPSQQNTVYLSLTVYEMVILLFSWNMLLRRGFGRHFWRFQ